MGNTNYAVVRSFEDLTVLANFTTYEAAYEFTRRDWKAAIIPTKTRLEVGSTATKADRIDHW